MLSILVEELEADYQTRLRLGYMPEAAPPDLGNVKSRINNRHDKKYAKKPTKGMNNICYFRISGGLFGTGNEKYAKYAKCEKGTLHFAYFSWKTRINVDFLNKRTYKHGCGHELIVVMKLLCTLLETLLLFKPMRYDLLIQKLGLKFLGLSLNKFCLASLSFALEMMKYPFWLLIFVNFIWRFCLYLHIQAEDPLHNHETKANKENKGLSINNSFM